MFIKFKNKLLFKFSLIIIPTIAIFLAIYITIFANRQSELLEKELLLKVETYAVSFANTVSNMMEHSIDSGEFTIDEVLNYDYTPITDPSNPLYVKGANPVVDKYAMNEQASKDWGKYNANHIPMRYHVPFMDFTTKSMTPIGDSYINYDTNLMYGVAIDKCGFVVAHNGKFSRPITGNPDKDFGESRVGRFFKDEKQVKISQNKEKKILLQSYDMDLATGTLNVWDVSYPIFVKGNLWGHTRFGYKRSDPINRSRNIAIIFYICGIILLILMFFVIYIPMKLMITKPLKQTESVLDTLSKGCLSIRCNIKTKDELGHLSTSMNMLSTKLENVIMSAIHSITGFTVATGQIAVGNQDLSQRTSEMASTLEEITASIEEVSANIDTNMQNAEKAKTLSDEIKGEMENLNDSSKKMHEIIQVIDSISFETNLLALNASIEAARAGEAGRGFEVVATEVKELSQRSSIQAKEIYAIIEESINKVGKNVSLVEKIVDLINEISVSSEDQHKSAKQISASISELNEVTQQNASLVEESAAASEEIAAQAKVLKKEISYFFSETNPEQKTLIEKTSLTNMDINMDINTNTVKPQTTKQHHININDNFKRF